MRVEALNLEATRHRWRLLLALDEHVPKVGSRLAELLEDQLAGRLTGDGGGVVERWLAEYPYLEAGWVRRHARRLLSTWVLRPEWSGRLAIGLLGCGWWGDPSVVVDDMTGEVAPGPGMVEPEQHGAHVYAWAALYVSGLTFPAIAAAEGGRGPTEDAVRKPVSRLLRLMGLPVRRQGRPRRKPDTP